MKVTITNSDISNSLKLSTFDDRGDHLHLLTDSVTVEPGCSVEMEVFKGRYMQIDEVNE